jgi:hypothetical protein
MGVVLDFGECDLQIFRREAMLKICSAMHYNVHLMFFFNPIFFLLKKKASAAFITNYVTGLNKTYKIFR